MGNHLNRGYVRVFRSVFDDNDSFWSERRERSNWEAWLYVLHLTHWDTEPGRFNIRGNVVPIYRGEVYISRRLMAQRLNWSEGKARQFLTATRRMERIVPTDRHAFGIYKVINYETYNPLFGTEADRGAQENNPHRNPENNPHPISYHEEHDQSDPNTDSSEPLDAAAEPVPSPIVFSFDSDLIVGQGSGPWDVTQDIHDGWVIAYPGVIHLTEYRVAAEWLKANPTKRKTRRGMRRFLNGWLDRAQNSPRRSDGTHHGSRLSTDAPGPRHFTGDQDDRAVYEALDAEARERARASQSAQEQGPA